MANNFCFIFDNINYIGELPYEIIPGHWFRKATSKEIVHIKKHLKTFYPYSSGVILSNEKEYVLKNENGTSWESISIPAEDWKYYVISFEGYNDKMLNIQYSANLIKNDLYIGIEFLALSEKDRYILGYSPSIICTFLIDQGIGFKQEIILTPNELLEIQNNYNHIISLDKTKYANIYRAISDFHQIKMITKRSVLKELSYFIIIESIITHDPSNTIDSLTHQVSTKMFLLSKRFQRELDYTQYFPKFTEPEKVWKKLYSYRSSLAHGTEANFKGEFKPLINRDNISKFLKESLKLLLLYALKEPEFITDFQKC